MTYERLASRSGIQWPCTEEKPDGTTHLYTDGHFPSGAGYCETYGHDLDTGASMTPEQYRAQDPQGRAVIKASDYLPPFEEPDGQFPFWLTTGRIVYQFHTRTKTGRVAELQASAPDPFVEISRQDAADYGIADGEVVEVRSRRGYVQVPARITGIRQGVLFIPFHYGYWDENSHARAANELTLLEWDPVSKQPHFKCAAVRIGKPGKSGLVPAFVKTLVRKTVS